MYGSAGCRGTAGYHYSRTTKKINYEFEVLKHGSSWWYTEIFDVDLKYYHDYQSYYSPHKYYKYRVELTRGWQRYVSWWWWVV